jgi:tetratricopeptide (TPR) repeat protein
VRVRAGATTPRPSVGLRVRSLRLSATLHSASASKRGERADAYGPSHNVHRHQHTHGSRRRTRLRSNEQQDVWHEGEHQGDGGDPLEHQDRPPSKTREEGEDDDRAEINERERIAYLRSLADLSQWEGNTQRAVDHLREAEALAEKLGLPKELWQSQSEIGYLHEQRGQTEEAREAFSLAAQTLRMLAVNIGDEKLREGFLSAARVRRVLRHN